jgi:pectate lyase
MEGWKNGRGGCSLPHSSNLPTFQPSRSPSHSPILPSFHSRVLFLFLVVLVSSIGSAAQPVAFPGAEGFGRLASGGRGGDVYQVSNLHDSGPGSLREAIRSAMGPRTIVFEISGTIELKSRLMLDKSAITIAGQTAPGDGITLKDQMFQLRNVTNVIVRYLRFRLGDQNKQPSGIDTLNTEDVDNAIFDP